VRVADPHLRASAAAARVGAEIELRALGDGDLQGVDLPEPRPVLGLEHDVAAGLQVEPVQRRLERERAPVDRRRQRQDRLLELAPHRAVGREARGRGRVGGHGASLPGAGCRRLTRIG
jgi:hypothetical protein